MYAGNLSYAVHDFLQVFQVGDFQDYVHAGLAVLTAGFYVADVGVGVADNGGCFFFNFEGGGAGWGGFFLGENKAGVFFSRPAGGGGGGGGLERGWDVLENW